MKLSLVKSNVVEFKSNQQLETITVLRDLLSQAESGEVVGIAGIFTKASKVTGNYCAGACCDDSSRTSAGLDRLIRKLYQRAVS